MHVFVYPPHMYTNLKFNLSLPPPSPLSQEGGRSKSYRYWPKLGSKDNSATHAYLEEIQSPRRHTDSMLDTSKSLNTPVVVHCRAGVACTGVFILNKLMISCLEHNERVEVPIMLGHLMQQRMLMVQTISQYKFVYEVVIQFLKNSHRICTLTSDL
ncbi:tyrosine-protein phosphatase non-receptor type 14-like [Oncorhynchus keta]|uniref:tyrosine-protein phosphatase non-receptor type 14-like n=1 Tax=Oncorhynchus keta TaxID=8018 RepID=UPI00227C4402|nr:tyrosine-protein phosphatase non-receptor type 14-like [Oncorhynchus keta]